MEFEWDEAKNATNVRKHGFAFADGAELFQGKAPLLVAAEEDEYGEHRWRGVGMIQNRVVVVVFTERQPNLIRFISLRKADREERQAYGQAIKDELGAH